MVSGGDRDRTCGLVVANDALSQLSYTPTNNSLTTKIQDERIPATYASTEAVPSVQRRIGPMVPTELRPHEQL
jgi:hypothetical protein